MDQLEAEAIERSKYRCEWVYPSEPRCQNTNSLKFHHRVYPAVCPSDYSVLCPVHHIMADSLRKLHIGQRPDIVMERARFFIDQKVSYLNSIGQAKNSIKFLERLARENNKCGKYEELAIPAWRWTLEIFHELFEEGSSIEYAYFSPDETFRIKLAAWRARVLNLSVQCQHVEDYKRKLSLFALFAEFNTVYN